MNYTLNKTADQLGAKTSTFASLKKLWPLLAIEKKNLGLALIAILVNSGLNLASPILIGIAIDKYVVTKQFNGVLVYSGILLVMYSASLVAAYLQTTIMGGVGQRTLFNLRSQIFLKLQSLPVAFFNQNKAGDLISRINNDTDKLSQFFSQALVQFVASLFMILGAGIFVISISPRLGSTSLIPALLLIIFTQLISPWIKKQNALNLKSVGGMSAEIQESLNNFKAIIAFNRRDYFREKFNEVNHTNYTTSVRAGLVNTIFLQPLYSFAANIAQLIVLAYGIYLIAAGNFTLGLLISFLSYLGRFYDPLRQIAALWSSFQVALASWDRITDILSLESNLTTLPQTEKIATSGVLAFDQVSFGYPDGKEVLHNINIRLEKEKTYALVGPTGGGKTTTASLMARLYDPAILEFNNVHFKYPNGKEVLHNINLTLDKGKTYALVGPTGGGKTTTASLMARLYDPTIGEVFLNGKDIRSYSPEERTKKIGFILQEPVMFSGTVRENILYGNEEYATDTNEQLKADIDKAGLGKLLERFDQGLETKLTASGDSVSLGQKQLIAFMRAVLRHPEILILDEATANIDTVTEKLLEDILANLSTDTTKIIIAHRLNTIQNADEIFFVNGGEVVQAGSMDHAMEMLLQHNRKS
jgi:ATP-binding cassette subfamily B protein